MWVQICRIWLTENQISFDFFPLFLLPRRTEELTGNLRHSRLCDTENTTPHWHRSHQAVVIGTATTNRHSGRPRQICYTHSCTNQWQHWSHTPCYSVNLTPLCYESSAWYLKMQKQPVAVLYEYNHFRPPHTDPPLYEQEEKNLLHEALTNELLSVTPNLFLTFPLRKCKEFQPSTEGVDRRARGVSSLRRKGS